MMTGGETNWKVAFGLLILGMAVIGGVSYFFIRGFERGSFIQRKESWMMPVKPEIKNIPGSKDYSNGSCSHVISL